MAVAFDGEADRARCHVVALNAGQNLAGKSPDGVIPPGGFVSVCSLDRGEHVFVTQEIGRDAPAPAEPIGSTGTITVE